MHIVLATSLRSALWSVVLAGWLSPLLQAQTFRDEGTIGQLPSDVTITPDGLVGVVRASSGMPTTPPYPSSQLDGLTAWSMETGQRLAVQGTMPVGYGLGENQAFLLTTLPAGPTSVQFSDLVQATNSRAIAIGSHRSITAGGTLSLTDDTTIVDFLQISSQNDPPVVSHSNHYAFFDATVNAMLTAGHAHDVAVTPNGAIAIVSHRNWVHFFTMRGGTLGSDNIGSEPVNFNGSSFAACSPDLSVDSVEATDRRAVVITTKYPTAGAQSIMMAYVYDLTVNPVQKLASFQIWDLDPLTAPPGTFQVVAHDLAITPNGSTAVVTGNFVVGLINLIPATPVIIGKIVPNVAETRTYRYNLDSVEVTNDRAVVGCTELGGQYRWSISTFNLNPASSVPMVVYHDPGTTNANDAHDIAITNTPVMGTLALVRSSYDLISFSVTTPPVAPIGF